ncbi:MAG: hypothetical protein ACHQET_00460 [Chitinophagales bacterium]
MNNQQRIILTRIVIGPMLIFLFIRFIQQATPSGMSSPPLYTIGLDITYWIYKLLHIPSLIIDNAVGAIGFDFLLFLSGILAFLFPFRKIFIIVFTVLVFIYGLSFNAYGMHHAHAFGGMMIVLLPFWFAAPSRFSLLWQGIRYYTCYVYGASFLWKAFATHSAFYWQQGVNTFKLNIVDYLYHNPSGLLSSLYRWCIREDWFLNSGNLVIVLLEAVMLIGFLTKKFDRFLFWIPVFIHVTTYFFSDVMFFEMLVLDISLLSIRQIEFLGKKIPLLRYQRKASVLLG